MVVLVAAVPGSALAQIPTPESVLGFAPGADFELATYEQSIDYFQQLAASSDRIQMVRTGRTSEGRDWWIAVISSPENLAALDRYKGIADRLAHPAGLTDDAARQLSLEGKAIVDISGGLHASEVAGAQHTIQLAWELVTSNEPRIAAIRENVITVLWPSLNPDGQTLIADWYASNVGTPYETSSMPQLYQKYVGHDNNRDAYMVNMIESRVAARTWQEWEPQIIYVHHQSSPFPTRIWLPPFAEPTAPQAPPIIARTVNTIGMTIASMLDSRGMPGATHMGTGFDAWYPGYIDYMPVMQNQAAFWTETALYSYATPYFYTLRDFPTSRRELRPESLYSSPWQGGWWRLGDAVDYMRVASIAVLDYAAKYREDLLYNRYQAGRDVIAKYADSPPYAYIFPKDQRDPVAPVELLRRLAFNGLRVYELTESVTHEGLTHAAGSWVLPLDQEFGELARQLMDVQAYPDLREFPDGPPEQPYDAAGWTLPYQMEVDFVAATAPLDDAFRGAMRALAADATPWDAQTADASPFDALPGVGFDSHPVATAIQPMAGRVTGSGSALRLDPAQNNTYRALNRVWDAGGEARFDAGEFVVSGISNGMRDAMVSELALQASAGSNSGTPIARPRVALYRPWSPSMDEGWTRWILEEHGFAFTNLRNADVHAGGLIDRYDVIVLPSEGSGNLMNGYAEGTIRGQYAGGLGEIGIRAIEAFVDAGGTLVCMSAASNLCIDQLHLPVSNVVGGLGRGEFFSTGSILQVQTDGTHPMMAGMKERAAVFFDRSPVFTTEEGFEGSVFAKYQTDGTPLMSGYLLGEEHLQGQSAGVDVLHGDGHVVLIGFRPQWRGQPRGSFRVLFNSLLHHGALAEAYSGDPEFWTKPESEKDDDSEAGDGRSGG